MRLQWGLKTGDNRDQPVSHPAIRNLPTQTDQVAEGRESSDCIIKSSPTNASILTLTTSIATSAPDSVSKLQQPIVLQLVSVCFGLLGWSLLGQLYRVAIENLKLGYDPWYGWLLLPATLVTGVAGAAIAYRGHRNHIQKMDATTQVRRFQFAGWFSLAPTIIIAFLWLAS